MNTATTFKSVIANAHADKSAGSDANTVEYRFWTEEKLRNADTDQQGHVNNAIFATFFEAARIDVVSRPEIADIREATQIVVVRTVINFRNELFFPGMVRIGTRVPRIGRTSLDFAHVLIGPEGVVADSEATLVLLDRATRKPMTVPEKLRLHLTGQV